MLTESQRDLLAMGLCPYCENPIRGWKPVCGFTAPEWYATMREIGVDPFTGHKQSCPCKEVSIGA
jgi:hypothetical protein